MDWNTQLHRMVSLCHMEAAEYERGRNLQVLQPSLVSLLHAGTLQQRPTPTITVTAQQPGRPTAAGLLPTSGSGGTPSHQQVLPQLPGQCTRLGPSGSCSSTHQLPERTTSINSIIKQEDIAGGNQAPAAAAVPAPAVPAMPTPLPSTPLAATANMQTPVSSSVLLKAGDAGLAVPGATAAAAAAASPAGRSLAGGVSNQQMALACNNVTRLPVQRADVPAATPQQQQFQLPCPVGSGAATITPMLVQQVDSTPLMQQVLMQPAKQQQQQPPASAQQEPLDSSQTNWNRKGKRAGYNIEPEALKRLVQKQLEVQREKLHSQQIQQQQQQDELLQSAPDQQQQQAPQRLQQQQQHRQRCLARVPQQYKQQDLDNAAAAVLESPGAAATGLQLHMQVDGLASPDACMGLSMPPCSELEQQVPTVQLELDASKMFGSAQKKLRLSMCVEEGHGLLPQTDLQLSLTSPVVFPSAAARMGKGSRAVPTAVLPAATGAAAAAGGGVGGSAAMAAVSAGAAAPSLGLATPSKFFAGSPVAASAAGGNAAADLPAPAFATPSKFFSGSPVDATARKPGQSTPETPLLFGHSSTSPWPCKLDMQQQQQLKQQPQQQQQKGLASACPLFKTASLGLGAGSSNGTETQPQPSSWVPVDGHRLSLLAATPDPAAVTATPAGAAVKVFCTPMGAVGNGDVMDAAAAAAAPVETLPIKPSAAPAAASAAAEDTAAAGGGAVADSTSLMTPPGQEQQVQATPVTAI